MTNPSMKIIDGTSTKKSYAVFAARGKAILAVKPEIICDGACYDSPGSTYVGLRVRSTNIEHIIDGEFTEKFAEKLPDWSDWTEAWPALNFDKNVYTHASLVVAAFYRGTPGSEEFTEAFADKKVAIQSAEYLQKAAGEGAELLVSTRELADWIDDRLAPGVAKLKGKNLSSAVSESAPIGVFGAHSKIVKDMYEATQNEGDDEVGVVASAEADLDDLNHNFAGDQLAPDLDDQPKED